MNHLFKCNLNRLDLALIAQFSEHHFAGVKCGLMDQYAVLFGEEDSLLLLDCRSMKHVAIPFPTSKCSIILVDTKVKHTLASSAYNKRRASCEEGFVILQKLIPGAGSLRDISIAQLLQHKDKLSEEVFTRCLFVTEEIARTQQAAQALRNGDLDTFGRLMFECHEGLRLKYEVSCPELDLLVDLAKQMGKQVIGSRLMGGGFGGCTVNLVRPGEVEAFKTLISTEYFATFRIEPEFYPVKLSAGTHLI
jgi:galactokinase